MEQSILNSTKKILGLDPSYDAFDLDVITHINTAFSTLAQLGVGPIIGFAIEDSEPEWSAFETDIIQLSQVKTYVYLKVRMLFDPPTTSYLIAAYNEQLKEVVWRINTKREETGWTSPVPSEAT